MKKVRFAEEVPTIEFSKYSDPAKKMYPLILNQSSINDKYLPFSESIQFSLFRANDIQKSSQIHIA
jgi:hypothetical protein